MARTVIDIDDDLLEQASRVLNTRTKKATVEAALRVVAAKEARRRLDAQISGSGMSPAELDRIVEEGWR